METSVDIAQRGPASRAELSLEISRLVSRVVKGEAIDAAASGAELAARFPDAGMSGGMIAEAIVSAAGMMGMIREGGATEERPARRPPGNGARASDNGGRPAPSDAAPDEPAAQTPETAHPGGSGAAPSEDYLPAEAAPEARTGIGGFISRGVRRAFFRR
ncbi:MAG: hypothetical protein ACRED5_09795 [Propylenella sp.]